MCIIKLENVLSLISPKTMNKFPTEIPHMLYDIRKEFLQVLLTNYV